MLTVGTFEAKTHLSRLLDRVVQGEEITITRHGEPVAKLIPVKPVSAQAKTIQVVAEIRTTRKGSTLEGLTVKELVSEGRRY